MLACFFFTALALTEIYTLSLHDALPIYDAKDVGRRRPQGKRALQVRSGGQHEVFREIRLEGAVLPVADGGRAPARPRSEEHTSELQSHSDLVCRLLLEKKKKNKHKVREF